MQAGQANANPNQRNPQTVIFQGGGNFPGGGFPGGNFPGGGRR